MMLAVSDVSHKHVNYDSAFQDKILQEKPNNTKFWLICDLNLMSGIFAEKQTKNGYHGYVILSYFWHFGILAMSSLGKLITCLSVWLIVMLCNFYC